MNATAKNEKTARNIINVLAENDCTVAEATEILLFVNSTIKVLTTVQKTDAKLFKTEDD